jgi:hypothetical protein
MNYTATYTVGGIGALIAAGYTMTETPWPLGILVGMIMVIWAACRILNN